MINQKISELKDEYGTGKMKLDSLWVLLIFMFVFVYAQLLIYYNNYGMIFFYTFRYIQALSITLSVTLLLGILFYRGYQSKIYKYAITTLFIFGIVIIIVLLIPAVVFLKTKQIVELVTRFQFNETKLIVFLISITITFLICVVYMSIFMSIEAILSAKLYEQLSIYFIFILIFMVMFFYSFNIISRWSYKLFIHLHKDISTKRRLLKDYFQNYKEQRIVTFLILLIISLLCFVQIEQDKSVEVILAAVTTFILFDSILDKWKSKFHKQDTEYLFVELLHFDIQIITVQLDQISARNRMFRARMVENVNLNIMKFKQYYTINCKYKEIINLYEELTIHPIDVELFNNKVYKIEEKIIEYLIKCE